MSHALRQFSFPDTSQTRQWTRDWRAHRAVADLIIPNSTNWWPHVGAVWSSSTPCFLAHFSRFRRTAGTQHKIVVFPTPSRPQIQAARVFFLAIKAPQHVLSAASKQLLRLSVQALSLSSQRRKSWSIALWLCSLAGRGSPLAAGDSNAVGRASFPCAGVCGAAVDGGVPIWAGGKNTQKARG